MWSEQERLPPMADTHCSSVIFCDKTTSPAVCCDILSIYMNGYCAIFCERSGGESNATLAVVEGGGGGGVAGMQSLPTYLSVTRYPVIVAGCALHGTLQILARRMFNRQPTHAMNKKRGRSYSSVSGFALQNGTCWHS